MSKKWLITPLFISSFLLGHSVLVWAITPSPAVAQSEIEPMPDSSCSACHIQEAPVYEKGIWHGIHARKDCCANCHGGNCKAVDENLAHQNLIANPLNDIYTSCHSCHPNDYQARAEIFAKELGITPRSISTPTPVPVRNVVESPLVILPSPTLSQSSPFPWLAILGGLPVIVLFLFGLITRITH